jgi:triosephosphate isomerase (TIM)
MPRKQLIAANWKMHSPPQGWDAEDSPYRSRDGIDVVVFPTFVDIRICLEKFLTVGAQYGRPEPTGAFTGDVSMQILAGHGCTHVLCGHSERRSFHGETDEFIAQQAKAALENSMMPIVCVGETWEQRERGEAEATVERQVRAINLPVIYAYEPVWAIGTGKTAQPEDAQAMHAFIRSLLPADLQETTHILYGGSVKPDNAKALLTQPDIDGALVGGASLDPKSFRDIVDAAPLAPLP